jgi:hypothetical protein
VLKDLARPFRHSNKITVWSGYLSLVLAVLLTLAGAAIAYDAITQHDIIPLVGSALATGLGLVWFRAVIKEWQSKA